MSPAAFVRSAVLVVIFIFTDGDTTLNGLDGMFQRTVFKGSIFPSGP